MAGFPDAVKNAKAKAKKKGKKGGKPDFADMKGKDKDMDKKGKC